MPQCYAFLCCCAMVYAEVATALEGKYQRLRSDYDHVSEGTPAIPVHALKSKTLTCHMHPPVAP